MRILLLLALCVALPVGAQQPTTACSGSEYDRLDFWVGTWDLAWEGGQGGTPEGETGHGVNTITAELDNCVIHESFVGDNGFDGQSFSIYDAQAEQWKQTWVDNSGGHLAFTGGLTEDGHMHFRTARFTDSQGREQVNRMIWTEVTENTLTWRWQTSRDGTGPWYDLWVIQYTRR